MSIYLIKINNNILGVYNDIDLALDYVYGLKNSNLIIKTTNIYIYKYKINSSIILEEYSIDLTYQITTKYTLDYTKKQISSVFIKNDELKYETDSILNTTP